MKRMVDVSKAHPFWGVARDGRLTTWSWAKRLLRVLPTKDLARRFAGPGERVVKVYLVVEDE